MSIRTWFTSDTHFSHANIIKYCNRPFASIKEMNMAMIERWNAVVGDNDIVYHLGDFAFTKNGIEIVLLTKALRGKIRLIPGNHDEFLRKDRSYWHNFDRFYGPRYPEEEISIFKKINGVDIFMSHYAMRVWNASHWGAWHLFGHSHNTLPDINTSLSLDVGVDGWNFTPVSFDQVKAEMEKRDFVPIDQREHEEKQVKTYFRMNERL